jgi:rhodanese-related sulfurtransferase
MQKCTVTELQQRLATDGDCQLIDVREYAEHAAERLVGARFMPLSQFSQHVDAVDKAQTVYVLCRSGARASQAAAQLEQRGHQDVRVVEGGLLAWQGAGFAVERGASKVWSLERQVRFTAGLIVLIGVVLAATVHPWFIGLSGFIGAGLVFSAATDTCAMGMVLARMPWNQQPAACAHN